MYVIGHVLMDGEYVEAVKLLKVVKTEEEAKAWTAEAGAKDSAKRNRHREIRSSSRDKFYGMCPKNGKYLFRAWLHEGMEELTFLMTHMGIDLSLIQSLGIEDIPESEKTYLGHLFYDKIPEE